MSAALWVIIPSAGKGKRFGSSTPKQYQTLLNSTVLQHALNRFDSRDDVSGIVLAVAPDDENIKSLSISSKVHVVEGGQERSDSVLNALIYLQTLIGENDLIAVHDAARPCIRKSSLDQLFEVSRSADSGAILALPATDTIKVAIAGQIEKTIDRNQVWMAQTPQVFSYKLLYSALVQAKENNTPVTDEASAIEMMGLKPAVVPGKKDNIKITSSEDLALAAFFLNKIIEEHD